MVELFVLAAPIPAVACNGTTFVDVKDYDQTCKVDADCVLVKAGDICCGCPNAGINKGDLPKHEDDIGTCDAVCDIGCAGNTIAVCDNGTCGTKAQ